MQANTALSLEAAQELRGAAGSLHQRCSAWAPGTYWEAQLAFPVGFFNPVKELHSAFLVEDESSSLSPVTEPVSQLLPLASFLRGLHLEGGTFSPSHHPQPEPALGTNENRAPHPPVVAENPSI